MFTATTPGILPAEERADGTVEIVKGVLHSVSLEQQMPVTVGGYGIQHNNPHYHVFDYYSKLHAYTKNASLLHVHLALMVIYMYVHVDKYPFPRARVHTETLPALTASLPLC